MMLIAHNNNTYFGLLIALFIVLLPAGYVHAADPLLTEVRISAENAKKLSSTQIQFLFKGKIWKLSLAESKTLYKTRNMGDGTLMLQLRPGAIYSYLNIHVSPRINNIGEQSRFVREGGNVVMIKGGTKGSTVDGMKTSLALRSALATGKGVVQVQMMQYRPSVFSAVDFEKLKFKDLLTTGETNFAGSPKNRVHNIKVGTARFNGLVIMPGEEFSFNTYLGNVDKENGYLPELVIKENVTTPEFGGGICQVSTTAFRAALAAGLKITERKNHSYPVSYYGAPGFDATVYPPHPDLKFTNDTGYPVYIATKITGTRLIFDFSGTLGNRQTTINGPYVTARYPDGSLTTAIAQFVKLNGKTIREQNFVSHYQSPDNFPVIRALNKG